MTVLSDKEVLNAINDGSIVIDPFDVRNLGNCSYDVRLGEYFYRSQTPSTLSDNLLNVYDEEKVKRGWGENYIAAPESRYYFGTSKKLENIKPNDKVIVISPGETILAHTEEFIGGRYNKTTMMKARSSFGRCFVQVCHCAGWGDIGYVNRWTMQISNNSLHYTIPLVVGRRIAQIVFIETGHSSSYEDKYQLTSSIDELRKSWKPEDMLPKLHLDREILAT